MGTINTRKQKVEWLKNAIQSFFSQNPQGKISKDKLIAAFCLNHSSTSRTAHEILDLLEKTAFIKIKGDDIILIQQSGGSYAGA